MKIDCFSETVRLIVSKAADTAVDVANRSFGHSLRFYGLAESTVSDQNIKFASALLKLLTICYGICFKISIINYPQTNAAVNLINKIVENYILFRCSPYHAN